MTKDYKEMEIDKWNGLQLQLYKETYGLAALNIAGGENTTYYKRWAYPQVWKNKVSIPQKKALPVAVRLGDKLTALKTLKELIRQIEEG